MYVITNSSSYHRWHTNIWKFIIPIERVLQDLHCFGKPCKAEDLNNSNSSYYTYTNYHIIAKADNDEDVSYSI